MSQYEPSLISIRSSKMHERRFIASSPESRITSAGVCCEIEEVEQHSSKDALLNTRGEAEDLCSAPQPQSPRKDSLSRHELSLLISPSLCG
jgi:hypothetical protein